MHVPVIAAKMPSPPRGHQQPGGHLGRLLLVVLLELDTVQRADLGRAPSVSLEEGPNFAASPTAVKSTCGMIMP
jgi:hypothetical protein